MLDVVSRAEARWSRWRLSHLPGVTLAPEARLARRPMMKGGCTLDVGRASIVEAQIDFERDSASITIGGGTFIGASTLRCAHEIHIGNDVEIAWNCTIVDHDWESLVWEERHVDMREWYRLRKDWSHVPIAAVRIRDRALIGFNSVVLKGVTIGEGAVVGVGSVVTHDVPPYTLVAGVPARIVRRLR